MSKSLSKVLSGDPLDDETALSLAELCRICDVYAEQIEHYVEEGIIEPQGASLEKWQFQGHCVRRIRIATRLQRDLRVNVAGAALAVELIEQIETLQQRLDESKPIDR